MRNIECISYSNMPIPCKVECITSVACPVQGNPTPYAILAPAYRASASMKIVLVRDASRALDVSHMTNDHSLLGY